jgi:hypothetical protein
MLCRHAIANNKQEDANDPPGLRLWWEYLHCDGWDLGFYNMLLKLKRRTQVQKK